MSTARYSECPRCKKKRNNKPLESERLYGKISPDEYLALLAKEKDASLRQREALFEDWEFIWESDGKLTIQYYANCSECGFEFNFKKEVESGI